MRSQIAEAKKRNELIPDDHDYSEAETRDYFIDLLLREAGWPLDKTDDREYPVTGMPNEAGEGFVDYVLWGNDGLPLAVVEAKRTKKDARIGRQQAKLYADCLETQFKQRPLIFVRLNRLCDLREWPRRRAFRLFGDSEHRALRRRVGEATLREARNAQPPGIAAPG